MSETFKIYIDRLRGGTTQKIDALLDPAFLDVNEPDLRFAQPVRVHGEAYLTDEHLVIHLKAKATANIPCAICNTPTETEISVDNFYHTEMLQEIRSGVFDFTEVLREAILIEVPRTLECNQGKCPERETISPYLRNTKKSDKTTHFPFTDL